MSDIKQVALYISEQLIREAKAQAALEGKTMGAWLAEAISAKLKLN